MLAISLILKCNAMPVASKCGVEETLKLNKTLPNFYF